MKIFLSTHDLYLRSQLCKVLESRLNLHADFSRRSQSCQPSQLRQRAHSDITTAYWGEASLQALKQARFHLLLLDMRQFRHSDWRCLRRLAGRPDAPSILALIREPAELTRGLAAGEQSLVDDNHCLPMDGDRLLAQMLALYEPYRTRLAESVWRPDLAIGSTKSVEHLPRRFLLKQRSLFGADGVPAAWPARSA